MLSPEMIVEKWGSLNHYDGGYITVYQGLPLNWHIGYSQSGHKSLLFLCTLEPGNFPSSESIEVSKGKRTDKKWTITFELLSTEQESVFTALCCDLIIYSSKVQTEQEALLLTSKRYKQWNKLLAKQRKHLLDENERRGLLGELLFLLENLKKNHSPMRVLLGWVGPEGSDQDFIYAESWYEVKTIQKASIVVHIASLEQLALKTLGYLVVYKIDKCPPEMPGSFTLSQLAATIAAMLNDNTEILDIYNAKLLTYGFMDLPEYDIQHYCCTGKINYEVNESFPRLTRECIPSPVIALQYSLDIAALTAWQMKEEQEVPHE